MPSSASDTATFRFSSLKRAALTRVSAGCGAAASRFNRLGALLCLLFVGFSAGAAEAQETAEADQIVLVAFGDSLIAGFGLPQSDGFTPQLQSWLNENGADDVIVINAGVSGDTTSGGLSRLDWSVGPEADAVLLELGGNDALRGVDPAIAKDNLGQMLSRLEERGLPVLLVGMRAPNNWGRDYAEAFAAMYPELAEEHGVPLYDFFFAGVFEDADYFQADRIHPNADGVRLIVEAIGPSILELVETARARQGE